MKKDQNSDLKIFKRGLRSYFIPGATSIPDSRVVIFLHSNSRVFSRFILILDLQYSSFILKPHNYNYFSAV